MMRNLNSLIFYSLALFGLCEAAVLGRSPSRLTTRASNSTICSNPPPNSCSFYPYCLESRLHCGSSGYPIGYGLHYCTLFTNAQSQLSSAGQAWITNTMLCLQRDLVPYGTGAQSTTCDALKGYAFGTHPSCYVNSGVCTLPPSDWTVIVNTVGLSQLFDSWDAFKATLQTAGDCTEFYAWLIENGIVTAAEAAGDAVEDAGEDIWNWATSWF